VGHLALCAACAWPAAWLIGLGTVALPFLLERVRPTATVRLPGVRHAATPEPTAERADRLGPVAPR
jgi:hypothetical protein